jgi:hypothetical protein
MGLLTSGTLNGSTGPHCSCLWAQNCLGKWFGIRWHRLLLKLWLSVHMQTRNCLSWYDAKVWSKLSGYQTWPAVCCSISAAYMHSHSASCVLQ